MFLTALKSEKETRIEVSVYVGSYRFPITANSKDSIRNVTEQIAHEIGFKSSDVKLSSDGRTLKKGTLHSNKVRNGSSVFLKSFLNLNVYFLNGQSRMFFVRKDWPVSKFVKTLSRQIDMEDTHLEYAGKPLNKKKTFKSFKIQSGSNILVKQGAFDPSPSKRHRFLCFF